MHSQSDLDNSQTKQNIEGVSHPRELKTHVASGQGVLPAASSSSPSSSPSSPFPQFDLTAMREKIKKSEDIGNVAKFMLLGTVLGAVYGWTKRTIDLKNDDIILEPKAHYFGVEPLLSKYFEELSGYRFANETAYSEALRKADAVLRIESQIVSTKQAKEIDLTLAQMNYKCARQQLHNLEMSINNGKDRVLVMKLKENIQYLLQQRLTSITRLTAPTRSLYSFDGN